MDSSEAGNDGTNCIDVVHTPSCLPWAPFILSCFQEVDHFYDVMVIGSVAELSNTFHNVTSDVSTRRIKYLSRVGDSSQIENEVEEFAITTFAFLLW